MQLEELFESFDLKDVRQFLNVLNQLINKLLITPVDLPETENEIIDYENASPIVNNSPSNGWISTNELRRLNQQLTEAINREKWQDGFLAALKLILLVK
jgi:hypothetical protein